MRFFYKTLITFLLASAFTVYAANSSDDDTPEEVKCPATTPIVSPALVGTPPPAELLPSVAVTRPIVLINGEDPGSLLATGRLQEMFRERNVGNDDAGNPLMARQLIGYRAALPTTQNPLQAVELIIEQQREGYAITFGTKSSDYASAAVSSPSTRAAPSYNFCEALLTMATKNTGKVTLSRGVEIDEPYAEINEDFLLEGKIVTFKGYAVIDGRFGLHCNNCDIDAVIGTQTPVGIRPENLFVSEVLLQPRFVIYNDGAMTEGLRMMKLNCLTGPDGTFNLLATGVGRARKHAAEVIFTPRILERVPLVVSDATAPLTNAIVAEVK